MDTMGQAYRGGNGGTATGSSAAFKATEIGQKLTIPMALDEQEKRMHGVFAAIGQLEERLNVVLSPRTPEPTAAQNGAPTPPQVFDRINATTNGLANAESWLLNLCGRLML
jgi:hypothetical protein